MKKTLKDVITLSSIVKIYVPSTTDIDKPTDNKPKVIETIKFLSGLFGGATSTDAVGAWVSDGHVITEKVVIVYAFCTTEQLKAHTGDILQYCYDMKKRDGTRGYLIRDKQ